MSKVFNKPRTFMKGVKNLFTRPFIKRDKTPVGRIHKMPAPGGLRTSKKVKRTTMNNTHPERRALPGHLRRGGDYFRKRKGIWS